MQAWTPAQRGRCSSIERFCSHASVISRPACSRLCCSTHDSIVAAPSIQQHSRRAVLAATLLLSQAAAAAQHPAHAARAVQPPGQEQDVQAWEFNVGLRIVALRSSVPQAWMEDFKAVAGKLGTLRLEQREQLMDIFGRLGDTRSKEGLGRADAATVGDAWLGVAVRDGLVQPLAAHGAGRWWDALYPRWRRLVTRDSEGLLDAAGQVWGVPYRWGCTLVAYRKDKLGGSRASSQGIRDWPDLLLPRLRGRIAFQDSPRELLAIAFKSLGLPLNATPEALAAAGVTLHQVQQRMQQLRQQALLFSSRDGARALSAGDAWAAVGSSSILIPLAQRSSNIGLVAPASGTILWADLWVCPAGANGGNMGVGPSPLLPTWLEFCMQPNRVIARNGLQHGAHPLMLPGGPQAEAAPGGELLTADSQLQGGTTPSAAVLRRSDFLEPCDSSKLDMYQTLLQHQQA